MKSLNKVQRPFRKAGITASVATAAALILSQSVVAASASTSGEQENVQPATPGEIVSVAPQTDGTVLTNVQDTADPVAGAPTPSGEQSFDQVTETTIYVDPPAGAAPRTAGLIARAHDQGSIRAASHVARANDLGSGANDGTASVNVWVNINYTVVQPSVIRANNWKSKYTRLDPNAVLVSGGVTHRNDRVPTSGTQSYSSPSSGATYTFTPSYAGFNTVSSNNNGIFGQAYLNWRIFGSNYTTYSGSVHPF